ncbi:MAG: hypothetical protein PHN98_01120 [Smithellaceae bacterium]|nr:hypothetical protein [Smithellaceae bacterium]
MTPEQAAAISAIASIIAQIGTWPIGTVIIAIMFGPWIMMWLTSRTMEKKLEAAQKMFDGAMEMYKNNIKLVENYERIADEQADTIRLSTAAITELTTWLKTKTPCHQLLAAQLRSIQK